MRVVFDNVGFYEILKIFFLKFISIIINKKIIFYYINSNNTKFTSFLNIKKLQWDHSNIKDENGLSIEILASRELKDEFLLNVIKSIDLEKIVQSKEDQIHIRHYIGKYLAGNYWPGTNNRSLESIIYTFLSIKEIFSKNMDDEILFYIPIFFKFDFFRDYAKKMNIVLKKSYRLDLFLSWCKFYFIFYIRTSKIFHKIINLKNNNTNYNLNINSKNNIIIEVHIQNFVEPFFLKNSKLNFSNIFFTNYTHKISKLDEVDLINNQANFLGFYNHIVENTNLPYFVRSRFHFYCDKYNFKRKIFFNYDLFYIVKLIQNFHFDYKIWYSFFKKTNAKIFLTNSIYDQHTIAASYAIKKNGGVSLSIRNSFCEEVTIPLAIHTDLYLSISKNEYIERNDYKFSTYKFNLPVGYYGDYKFLYLSKKSEQLRKKLLLNGAKFIISFFDQGYISDSRYSYGYERSANNYKFLLEKLLSNKNMGLLLKPKKPGHIYRKLGIITDILQKAINTGRCHIELGSEGGTFKLFRRPPAYFAMASDLVIHEAVVSATAGIESYLSGTKTIFCDFYGYHNSLFNKNAESKKLIFDNLNKLWEEIESELIDKNKRNLGDWGNLKKYIDEYNDMKSDHRISEILFELHNNYNLNIKREFNLIKIKEFYNSKLKNYD